MIWAIAAIPPALLATCLAVPALRERLLGAPLPLPAERAAPPPVVRVASPPAGRAAASSDPAAAPPRQSTAPVLAPQTTPATAAAAAPPVGIVLDSTGTGRLVETAYRPFLPGSVGAVHASVAEGKVGLEAEVDLVRLRAELSAPVPEVLAKLLGGTARIRLATRLVESGGGVVRLRIEGVSVGPVPLPSAVIAHFMEGELTARGYVVGDPLVRSLRLPAGMDAAEVVGDHLVLHPVPGR
jgi:hypothetical protein